MATPKKKWTVMIYLAGDNNLDSAGVADLKEMKKVGSTDDVNVIAQFDRAGKTIATKRYYLTRGGTLAKDEVKSLGETNMGDPHVLKDFLRWGLKTYPAEHNLIVLWNHGAGWDDTDVYRVARKSLGLGLERRGVAVAGSPKAKGMVSIGQLRTVGTKKLRRALFATSIEEAVKPGPVARAIAFDDSSKDFLDNLETKRVLASIAKAAGGKIDILGMDACLMSMAEVAYQVRDSVSYTVGSEEIEPGDGWPYDSVLRKLTAKPAARPAEVAKMVVTEYLASYGATSNVTQSSFDLAKAPGLAAAITTLGKTLKEQMAQDPVRLAIVQARLDAQTYDVRDYIDLYDFCDLLLAATSQPAVRAACTGVMTAIKQNGFVIQAGYKGSAVQHSMGCAIYFPQNSLSPLYGRLDFCKDTSWDEFLNAYLDQRSRRTRASEPGPIRQPTV